MPKDDRPAGRWRRRVWIAALLLALLAALALFAFTSGAPAVADRPAPSADQVGAGRKAALQLSSAESGVRRVARVHFGQAELDGIAALASHGFRPNRLALALKDGALVITGSHRLAIGRWVNVSAQVAGRSQGFPPVRLTIGKVTLPPWLSRPLIAAARWVLVHRGVALAPLDMMVRHVVVDAHAVAVTLRLPAALGGIDPEGIDPALVARVYCRLARAEQAAPAPLFVDQVHRAFATRPAAAAPAAYNRAAFVALAMLLVDQRAGDIAGAARSGARACAVPAPVVTLHGRADLPKHWALSAALAAGAGSRIARAMGEWKELADGLSKQSTFAVGDPTGFSFVDLSADRAGFHLAQAGADPDRAAATAARLAHATEDQLLPLALVRQQDGMPNAEFVRRFGSIDDPRYAAMVARIDAALAAVGIR